MPRAHLKVVSSPKTVTAGRPLCAPLDPRTGNLLGTLVTALNDAMEASLEDDLDIGGAAPASIITIGNCPGHSVSWLADVLQLTHSGTVRLLDSLTEHGLVERRATADARTLALHLTDKGRRRMNVLLAARRACIDAAISGLSAADQQQLARLLEHMLDNLTVSDRGADSMCRMCDEHVCPQDSCPITLATVNKELQPA